MFILGYFLSAVATILNIVLSAYMFIIIARAILSFVSPDPYNPIVRFINNVTDPLLDWIRRKIPVVYGGIDLSPAIVILGIIFLQSFLVQSLYGIANSLK